MDKLGECNFDRVFLYSDVFLPRAYRRNCFVRPSINVLSKDTSFDMIWTETFHSGH